MKKFIAGSLIAVSILLNGQVALAEENKIGFFEAMANTAEIEDYKSLQSFYGRAEIEEDSEHLSVAYRVSFNSSNDANVNNPKTFNRVSANVKIFNHNEPSDNTPFKEMTFQLNGDLTTIGYEDIYMRFNNFSANLVGAEAEIHEDIEMFKAMIAPFRGTWYHLNQSELAEDEFGSEFSNLLGTEELISYQEDFKEDPKKAIIELSEKVISDPESGLSEDDIADTMTAVRSLIETEFFTQREILSGRNKGFTFFNIKKTTIVNWLKDLAKQFNEEMSEDELSELNSALRKFSLSGVYRIEDTHNIIDNLLVRFKLRDIEALKNFELNMRFKLSDINKKNTIKAPSSFKEFDDIFSLLSSLT